MYFGQHPVRTVAIATETEFLCVNGYREKDEQERKKAIKIEERRPSRQTVANQNRARRMATLRDKNEKENVNTLEHF